MTNTDIPTTATTWVCAECGNAAAEKLADLIFHLDTQH